MSGFVRGEEAQEVVEVVTKTIIDASRCDGHSVVFVDNEAFREGAGKIT